MDIGNKHAKFLQYVWGSPERQERLHKLLSCTSRSLILTRGMATHVREALDDSKFTQYFTHIVDTFGTNFTRAPDGKWQEAPKIPLRGGREILKDEYIRDYVHGSVIIYVDDSPETAALPDHVELIRLQKEALGGIFNEDNKVALERLQTLLANHPDAVVVWDFDCTLTARHLYKSWFVLTHRRRRGSFPRWAAELDNHHLSN